MSFYVLFIRIICKFFMNHTYLPLSPYIHISTHQDDSQAADQTIRRASAGSWAVTADERRTPDTGRFWRHPATPVTNFDSDSNSASGQQPRAV